jgi:hypothetical protein
LEAAPERNRRDVWWVGTSPEEVLPVAADIAWALTEQAHPWFLRLTDLNTAFQAIEGEKDCLNKFYRAKWFAAHLQDDARLAYYTERIVSEARRIGFPDDGHWPSSSPNRKRR